LDHPKTGLESQLGGLVLDVIKTYSKDRGKAYIGIQTIERLVPSRRC
jgi:hypothetical protein